jgi:hypothetical protein
MEQDNIKPIFIILVDISGYTRFIKFHKISLLHAEKIIAELMESILSKVEVPVIAHEILGDAISFYALDENLPDQADKIYNQLQQYFNAFREREAYLISECSICKCEACQLVGKLKLKAILHHGEAAFTHVNHIQKISGENVILSHRLLKNTLNSKEYILMTSDFYSLLQETDRSLLTPHREEYEDMGKVNLMVHLLDQGDVNPKALSFKERLKGFFVIEGYMIGRIFKKNRKQYLNLPE